MLKSRSENTELNITLWALALSLLIHVLFGGTIELFGTKMENLTKQKQVSTVDLVDEQPKKMSAAERNQQQIVRSAKLPDELIDKNKKSKRRFLSEDDQNVLEETRAANSGMTANRSEAGQQKQFQNQQHQAMMKKLRPNPLHEAAQEQAKEDTKDQSHMKSFDSGDVQVAGMAKANQRNIAQDNQPLPMPNMGGFAFDKGQSTTGEQMPSDIKVGRFTALNTDRYLYYAFYARAEELFRHHWEKYAEAAMYTYQQSHRVGPNEMYTCRLEILLDKNGTFVKGILRESSTVPGLDQAPVRAFHDAQRIPNPPPEMVKQDGFIHMDYMFTVVNSPAYAAGS